MGRAKMPRKSTSIDMTAMCDVAFLLLSFFILATKPKPTEVVPVVTPSSVSTLTVENDDPNKVTVTISKEGKVFLTIDDPEKRKAVVKDLNTRLGLQLTDADMAKLDKVDMFGTSLAALKSYVNLPAANRAADKLSGIPAQDSATSQMRDWMGAVSMAYYGGKINLLVKGDGTAKYPVVKVVIDAFKKSDLMKFSVITNKEGLGPETELYKEQKSKKKEG